jgi:hypothetical protein
MPDFMGFIDKNNSGITMLLRIVMAPYDCLLIFSMISAVARRRVVGSKVASDRRMMQILPVRISS